MSAGESLPKKLSTEVVLESRPIFTSEISPWGLDVFLPTVRRMESSSRRETLWLSTATQDSILGTHPGTGEVLLPTSGRRLLIPGRSSARGPMDRADSRWKIPVECETPTPPRVIRNRDRIHG